MAVESKMYAEECCIVPWNSKQACKLHMHLPAPHAEKMLKELNNEEVAGALEEEEQTPQVLEPIALPLDDTTPSALPVKVVSYRLSVAALRSGIDKCACRTSEIPALQPIAETMPDHMISHISADSRHVPAGRIE